MESIGIAERLVKHERVVAAAGLAALAILAWLFVLDGAGTGMSVRAMSTWRFPPPLLPAANESWPAVYWLVMLAMWWVMMIAMMVPSAAPAILVYARVARHAQKGGQAASVAPVGWFAAGYLLAWLAFSIAAVLVQWGLERLGLMHMMMMWSLDTTLSAAILLAAGLYELSPFKDGCLRSCRMPAEFLARNWRPGIGGAIRLGVAHGLYCVGCCAMLMALLFVGGIMNLIWIAGLSGLILAEKLLPAGRHLARLTGIALIAGGGYVLAAA